jgi:hypothetical protein
MPTPCRYTGDANESSEDHLALRAERASKRERSLPRLPPPAPMNRTISALTAHPRTPGGAVLGREAEMCFEVTVQGLVKPEQPW